MGARFKNSRNRVQRAADHAIAFADEWDIVLGNNTTRSKLRADETPGWWAIFGSLTPTAQERADRNILSLELGEFAYQLRAALDGLMWEVVTVKQGFEPPPDAASRLEFPILNGKNRDFKQCGFHKFPFPQQLSDWLESIQPDAAEKPVGDPDRGLKVTLEDIHNLASLDRHRRLRIIAALPKSMGVTPVTMPAGGRIVAHEWSPDDLFSGEKKLARLKIECPGGLIPYYVRLEAHVSIDISVEDIEMYEGKNLAVQLTRFVHAVHRAIDKFEEEGL